MQGLVEGNKRAVVHQIELGGSHLVEGGHGAAGLGQLGSGLHELAVFRDEGAHARTAQGEAVGRRVHQHQLLLNRGQLTEGIGLAVVDEFAIGLVHDQPKAPLLDDVRNELHFGVGKHLAGGIAGIAQQDRPGLGGDEGLNLLAGGVAIVLFGGGEQGADLAAADGDDRAQAQIEGLRHDDLAVGVQDALHGEHQRLAGAGSDENVLQGVVHAAAAVEALQRLRHDGQALGRGVVQGLGHIGAGGSEEHVGGGRDTRRGKAPGAMSEL